MDKIILCLLIILTGCAKKEDDTDWEGDNMRTYTKGPWIAEGSRIVSEGKRNLTIARVGVAPDGDYSTTNARLIAAAPELLEACKAIINDLDNPECIKYIVETFIKPAILKAEGE